MDKEFITYEQSLDLKELGFDEPCFGYYVDGELRGVNLGIEELNGIEPYYQRFGFHTLSNHNIDNPNKIVVTTPTYSQAFRWFREKHDLHSHISLGISYEQDISGLSYDEYVFVIEGINKLDYDNYGEEPFYKTPEEAELACLIKLIETVKNKQDG